MAHVMPPAVVGTRTWIVAVVAVALVGRPGVVAAPPGYRPPPAAPDSHPIGRSVAAATPGSRPLPDDRDYDRMGGWMASGRGYPPVRVGHVRYADAYRPPLWPAALGLVYAVTGHDLKAARLADAALGALGAGL